MFYTKCINVIIDSIGPSIILRSIDHFLSIQYAHGDLCKHLGKDSSTDHPDRYSNLFLNASINRHVNAKYLKRI